MNLQEQFCHHWGTISTHWNTNSLLIDMTTNVIGGSINISRWGFSYVMYITNNHIYGGGVAKGGLERDMNIL